eukprot:m.67785 g.67785  ORF g.67785 m.67785 type:complete len:261 (+) comp35471_c0_seq3:239-1021(+)
MFRLASSARILSESKKHPGKNMERRGNDLGLVQITAARSEIDRRIAAFAAHKRQEIDNTNLRFYFPNRPDVTDTGEPTCARTQAIFKKRILIRTQSADFEDGNEEFKGTGSACVQEGNEEGGVEERLGNMEVHMGLSQGKPARGDVYNRLKRLEERILYLEGMSPEYFQHSENLTTTSSGQTDMVSDVESYQLSHSVTHTFRIESENSVTHTFSHPASAAQHTPERRAADNDMSDLLTLEEIDQRMAKLQKELIGKQKST